MGHIKMEMTFDAGHRIVGHKGKCARLHGHTYRAVISMTGHVKDPGFVVDFGDVKDLVNRWDHMLLLWENDALVRFCDQVLEERNVAGSSRQDILGGLVVLPFNPTAEHMASQLASTIRTEFDLIHCKVELWETPKACAVAHSPETVHGL